MVRLIRKLKARLFYKNLNWCEKYINQQYSEFKKIQRYNPVLKVKESPDRIYIEKFIEDNRKYIKGQVLEFRGTENYAEKYIPQENVTYCAGLKLKHNYKPEDNIKFFFDFEDINTFPKASFDCIIFTQCLVYTLDPLLVLSNMQKLLKPDGVMLVSTDSYGPQMKDGPLVLSLTQSGLKKCFERLKDKFKTLSLKTYGGGIGSVICRLININRNVCEKFADDVESYPILITAVVQKI